MTNTTHTKKEKLTSSIEESTESAEKTNNQAEANARLIAGAPALLEACELTLRMMPDAYWIGALQAAIAAARGQS